jgi:hypothetical protein
MPNRARDPTPSEAATIPPGLVGVFQTLAAHHRLVAAMFDQLEASPELAGAIWPGLRRELASHERSQARALDRVLRPFETTRPLTELLDADARDLDALVCRLDALDVRGEEWSALFDQLVTTVRHHARDDDARRPPFVAEPIGEARAIELDATPRKVAPLAESN